jgi:signal peptidase
MLIAYALIGLAGVLLLQGYVLVRVSGGSMKPALLPGDVVFVARTTQVSRGDIALLKPGAGMVLHRVARVEQAGRVWTRGDANPIADLNPVARRDVIGRVVRVLPLGGIVERWRAKDGYVTLPTQPNN